MRVLDSCQSPREPLRIYRLEQIVESVYLECTHREFIMRGGKDDLRQVLEAGEQLETRAAGHLNVEEQQFRGKRFDLRRSLIDVGSFVDDLYPREFSQQKRLNSRRAEGLVIDDHRPHGFWGMRIRVLAAAGCDRSRSRLAREPNSSLNLSSELRKPMYPHPRRAMCFRRPRILDFQYPCAVLQRGADPEHAARGKLRDAVLNCVLDDGLQQHHRNAYGTRVCGNIVLDDQPFLEAHRLELEIVRNDLELLRKRDQLIVTAAQRIAQGICEASHRALGLRWMIRDERAHGVQCVEQKMWVELGLEQTKFGLLERACEFGLSQFRPAVPPHRLRTVK